MIVTPIKLGLQQFGIFGKASFSTLLNQQDRLRYSSDSVLRIQKKAKRDPSGLSRLIKAAAKVDTQSPTFVSDVETTGVIADQYGPHRIVALGLVAYNQENAKDESFEYILNPHRPCNTPAIKMHGLQSTDLASMPTLEQAFPGYLHILDKDPDANLWFYNAAFDKNRIISELKHSQPNYASAFEAKTIFCSYQLALTIRPKLKGHNTLDNLCKYYGISLDSRANGHGALIDCYLLMQLLNKLAEDVLGKAQEAKILDAMLEHPNNQNSFLL